MAPYFCDYIQRLILNNPAYGADHAARERFLYQDGLTIQTTLDPKLQQVAQDQVNCHGTCHRPVATQRLIGQC